MTSHYKHVSRRPEFLKSQGSDIAPSKKLHDKSKVVGHRWPAYHAIAKLIELSRPLISVLNLTQRIVKATFFGASLRTNDRQGKLVT
jgi:hypothetical protein